MVVVCDLFSPPPFPIHWHSPPFMSPEPKLLQILERQKLISARNEDVPGHLTKSFYGCPLKCHRMFDLVSEAGKQGEEGTTRKKGVFPARTLLLTLWSSGWPWLEGLMTAICSQTLSSRTAAIPRILQILADSQPHCCAVNFEEVFKW